MSGPFELDDSEAYQRWRDAKLVRAITDIHQLVVEIDDPTALTAAEHAALRDRCQRSNMAIYATRRAMSEPDIKALGTQFGLQRLDANWLADDLGITRITVCSKDGQRQAYIPYTNRPIKWHTDGYYNPPERQIRAMVLHCAHDAAQGGENRLLDHEIAYLLLREADPEHICALSAPDAMTIPERTDEHGVARPAQTGPVFSVDDAGHLHMRYTARTRSIEWKDDDATRAAVKALEHLLESDSPHIFRTRLSPGMGLLCNNVLHDRAAFTDAPTAHQRLLYRARYLERITLPQTAR
ncbi:TauD/TfdA family dioxygenase [Ferriphaselus sp. R-1]|uniref:TauD/TfdA family dioxygenase n=1 Tax=Ferriphaselus sp. R-1 TaxID=1485544 RepID=UPI00054DC71D|nr:TauD/TfdA family dioxygenase [Ferriphaselus sp. R-1]